MAVDIEDATLNDAQDGDLDGADLTPPVQQQRPIQLDDASRRALVADIVGAMSVPVSSQMRSNLQDQVDRMLAAGTSPEGIRAVLALSEAKDRDAMIRAQHQSEIQRRLDFSERCFERAGDVLSDVATDIPNFSKLMDKGVLLEEVSEIFKSHPEFEKARALLNQCKTPPKEAFIKAAELVKKEYGVKTSDKKNASPDLKGSKPTVQNKGEDVSYQNLNREQKRMFLAVSNQVKDEKLALKLASQWQVG